MNKQRSKGAVSEHGAHHIEAEERRRLVESRELGRDPRKQSFQENSDGPCQMLRTSKIKIKQWL